VEKTVWEPLDKKQAKTDLREEKPAGPQKMPWTSSLLVLRIKERLRLVVYCSM
jgi:hypothetical protein